MSEDAGTLPDGRRVQVSRLAAGGLDVAILTLGATLQDVRLAGVEHSLTLGSPDPAAYLGDMPYFGALVGPVANRISGASAEIDGVTHRFEALREADFSLHSGSAGVNSRIWSIEDEGPDHVALALDLPHGEGGYPGTRRMRALWRLQAPATLRLELSAQTDAPTLLNLANHSYWNLDGSADWEGHSLQVLADRYLPTTPDNLPTGEIVPVEGTPYDFREPRRLDTATAPRLDNNFCLSQTRRDLLPALRLTGRSGVSLEIATTEPGIQVFDMATFGSGAAPTLSGRPYAPRAALAFEPQFWPDAPTHPHFPPIVLRPGTPWRQVSEWRFATP